MSSRTGQCRESVAEPVYGVVLAGGRARRMGGRKTSAVWHGRPLVRAPIQTMLAAELPVVVCAKARTPLPDLDGVRVLLEPDTPTHPLVGVAHALRVLRCPIVVCAGDMPHVPAGLVSLLATTARPLVTVLDSSGRYSLLARFEPTLLNAIERAIVDELSLHALFDTLTAQMTVLGPDDLAQFGDPRRVLRDIDTPEQLDRAAREDGSSKNA